MPSLEEEYRPRHKSRCIGKVHIRRRCEKKILDKSMKRFSTTPWFVNFEYWGKARQQDQVTVELRIVILILQWAVFFSSGSHHGFWLNNEQCSTRKDILYVHWQLPIYSLATLNDWYSGSSWWNVGKWIVHGRLLLQINSMFQNFLVHQDLSLLKIHGCHIARQHGE